MYLLVRADKWTGAGPELLGVQPTAVLRLPACDLPTYHLLKPQCPWPSGATRRQLLILQLLPLSPSGKVSTRAAYPPIWMGGARGKLEKKGRTDEWVGGKAASLIPF